MTLTSHRAHPSAGHLAPGAHVWAACVGGNSDMLPLVDCEFSGQNRGEVGHYWGEVGAYGLWKTCGPGGSRGISLTSRVGRGD